MNNYERVKITRIRYEYRYMSQLLLTNFWRGDHKNQPAKQIVLFEN